jgi:hypothetical protein
VRAAEAKAERADRKSAIDSLKHGIAKETISQLTNEQKAKLLHDALREAGSAPKLGEVFCEITDTYASPTVESRLEVLDQVKKEDF